MSFNLTSPEPSRFAHQGKNLEKLIERTALGQLKLIKIRDSYAYGGKLRGGTVPCDFIGHISGHPLMVEAKESAQVEIPRSVILRKRSFHQFEAMRNWIHSHPNNRAGYLCHTEGHILTWVPVQEIQGLSSVSRHRWRPELSIRGVDLLKDPIDWVSLILGDDNGDS